MWLGETIVEQPVEETRIVLPSPRKIEWELEGIEGDFILPWS